MVAMRGPAIRVCYLPLSPTIASARLRGIIPARELHKSGFLVSADTKTAADWLVLSKHGWSEDFSPNHKRILFDVCDNHFGTDKGAHYVKWCRRADKVTCNTPAMAAVIERETGVKAVVIPDPYEGPELAPKCNRPLLWFGHKSNLSDLLPWLDRIGPTVIVSNHPAEWVTQWSPENMAEAFKITGLTVIPTGEKQAKSANRAIEAIRAGHFPVCGRLPAYEELGLGCDDIAAGVEAALADPEATMARVASLQDRVRAEFSPQRIGELWAECFST